MMLVMGPHKILLSTLKKLRLGEEKRLKAKTVNLVDFGARIKVIVSMTNEKSRIELQVTFHEDYEIHDESIRYLRMLYGSSVGYNRFDGEYRMDISINANEALSHFDSPHSCAISLSQIRVQAAGAPILKGLSRIDDRCPSQTPDETSIYKLGRHGKCGTYYCINTDQK
mmetsp:Transcript_16370/g.37552  ORF Transcript_16370/g.37552 Transcript_16370/m.37552 type:complete len:169 (+) Transcript_16370:35-541(+)